MLDGAWSGQLRDAMEGLRQEGRGIVPRSSLLTSLVDIFATDLLLYSNASNTQLAMRWKQ